MRMAADWQSRRVDQSINGSGYLAKYFTTRVSVSGYRCMRVSVSRCRGIKVFQVSRNQGIKVSGYQEMAYREGKVVST